MTKAPPEQPVIENDAHDRRAPWLTQLASAAAQRRQTHSQRTLQPVEPDGKYALRNGQRLLNLAGNDYLALGQHRALIRAATEAIKRLGTGSGASRLVTGTLEPHTRLEQRFAAFKHADAALLFPTGYMANLAVLTSLARGSFSGGGDLILQDKLNHASLIDAARFSGAAVRTFPHRGYDKLERLLRSLSETHENDRRVFIVTDAVFSMDGTVADLPRLVGLAEKHGAILVVDEAHATGVLGNSGAGLAERQGVAGRIGVTISTASKALGSMGGIVTADAAVIDHLTNTARPFIYTTAVPPSIPAGIDAALDVIRDEPQRRQRLADITTRVRRDLRRSGWDITDDPTPIIPLIVGDNAAALGLARRLQDAGILAVAIRPPSVAPGSARVRLSLRADLTDEELDRLHRVCSG